MARQNLQTDDLDPDPNPNPLSQTENEMTAADQLKSGISYFNAYYVKDNCSTAFKWFKLSAEQGNVEAQFRLAELYSLGLGIPKSHADAYKWYTIAAILGYKKALIRIHNLYQEDIRMHCRGKLDSQENLRKESKNDREDENDEEDESDEDESDEIDSDDENVEYVVYDIYSKYDIYKKRKKLRIKNFNFLRLTSVKQQLDNRSNEDQKPEYHHRELYDQRLDDHKLELNHAIKYYAAQFKKYKSSNQEDPEVQQNLGFLYQHGYGVKKYEKWAIEYYTKAAEQGYINSQYQLGYLYQKNTDIKFNYKKAYYWYHLAATGGHIAAQNQLAYLCEKGLGTHIDYQHALYWYTKAAESGHSMAQLTLGKWYRKGQHVDLNYTMAVKWYTLAARQGNSVAQNCLVQLYQKEKICDNPYESEVLHYSKDGSREGRLCSKLQADIPKIKDQLLVGNIKTLAKRALMGDGNAMYEIGLKYYNGTDLNENKLIGFRWIKNAANTGHKNALFRVTKTYEEGDIVQQDFYKAAIWTKKHVKHKNDIAQCNLGILYKEGRGVRSDPLEASRWFTLSADQENREAQYQLGCLRQTGIGLRKNEEEALELFNLLAKKGDVNGCYALGIEFFHENRSKIDETTALKLLEYSANHGNENAQYEMWTYHSELEDQSKADFYFDMLICSNNAYIINRTLIYSMSDEDFDIDYIKYFNYLKKAANLGIPLAKELFTIPPTRIINKFVEKIPTMFFLVSEKVTSSVQYNIGYMYECIIDIPELIVREEDEEEEEEDTDTMYNIIMRCYLISAEKGDSRAQVQLGILYEKGEHFDLNFEEAINYYNLAYKNGNTDAMYRLACMYLDGRGVPQDLEKAYKLYTQASDMGHIEARKVLMLPYDILEEYSPESIYYQRVAVKTNDGNQIKMLEKMAHSGLVAIQYQLGDFYENKDDLKAINWFTLAAHGGVTDAYYRLGVLYEDRRGTKKDNSQSIIYYKKAVINEHEGAMYRLAQIYLYGKGTEINYIKAYQLYSRAATMGHSLSSRVLGFGSVADKYQDITNISKDKARISFNPSSNEFKHVLLMFQCVAKEGDVEVQYRLGVIYDSIFDIPNYEEAAKWYSMAANNSHREAMYRLGSLNQAEASITQDYQKAIHIYHQAYKLGSYDALYRLGAIYHYGIAADTDYEKAARFYKEAANNGHLESQHALGKLYEEGLLIERNLLEALKLYTQAYLKGYDPARTDLCAMYDDPPFDEYYINKLNDFLLAISKKILLSGVEKYNDNYGFIFYRLGIQYLYGNGIPQDYKESFKCFKIASEKFKNSAAQDVINIKYSGNRAVFIELIVMYEALFDTLKPSQQYKLAMVYYNGVVNETKNNIKNPEPGNNKNTSPTFDEGNDSQDVILATDYKKTISLLEKIQGDHCNKAQVQLAKMYTHGHGATKNIEKAIEYYIKASDGQPNHYAFEIAQIYHFDDSFRDFSKAIEWYTKADVRKKGAALNVLGLIYKSGNGVNQDYGNSLQFFKDSADELSGAACKYSYYNLGLMCYHGYGTEQDYAEAKRCFIVAAENGHVKSHIYLANIYLNGYGVEKNVKKAKKIYKRAFDMTYTNKNIGIAEVSDFIYGSEAIEWLKKVEDSDPIICLDDIDFCGVSKNREELDKRHTMSAELVKEISFTIGEIYYTGKGAQIDYSQAYTYFVEAAEAGYSEAQEMLVEMYTHGLGVDKDIEKVIEWYTKASNDKPNRYAFRIARLYERDDDFRDYAKALEWYTKAAENGSDYAAIIIGEIYHYNDKTQDFSKALYWYQKGLEDSEKSYALRGIGLLFEYGDGVDQDYEKSVEYYQQSVDWGNKGGLYNLALIYYYGKGVEQNFKKCFDLLNESVEEDLRSGCAYVFVRIEGDLSTNIAGMNRTYSLEHETILYGEVYLQLGIMHKHGQGTPQDDSKAEECFLKAIEYGNEQAKNQMK